MRWPPGMGIMLAIFCCHTAQGAEQATDRAAQYSAEVSVGAEFDSNVAVDELDASSSESDYAATLDGELAVDKPLSDNTELGLSYDFSQNLYREFKELNRQTHILGANLVQDYERLDAGVTAFYIRSLLDGESFLSLTRVSPSLSGFLGKRWFGRGAYVYSDKDLEQSPERDATTHAGEADLYFFRRGLRSYFNLGYRFKNENARAEQYDYHSHNIKLRYIHRFELPSRTLKLELAWRYEDRNYLSETPSIGEDRADKRQRWQLDLEIPVLKQAAVQIYSGYGDYSSNYAPADYDQLVVGSRFIYRW